MEVVLTRNGVFGPGGYGGGVFDGSEMGFGAAEATPDAVLPVAEEDEAVRSAAVVGTGVVLAALVLGALWVTRRA